MVPFLQNANSLTRLDLYVNNIQSEGFNLIFRALRDSPIEHLDCCNCGIESIDIDGEHIPRNLKYLLLSENSINADGCRELAKLLQGGDATLDVLTLVKNRIDDEGVEILVGALQNNSSMTQLDLAFNNGISFQGEMMVMKLVNDISSIEATLRSNHTLECRCLEDFSNTVIEWHLNEAFIINSNENNPEAAGKAKVIKTQLHSERRAELAELQGVNHSVYSEINPLHLPEVLALVGHHNGHGELYHALKSSIAELFSMVNMKQCIQNEAAYHAAKIDEHGAKLKELNARLAAMDDPNHTITQDIEVHNSKHKRRRV